MGLGSGSRREERETTLTPDDWQLKALCRGNHAHLFFPPSTFERKDDRERREARAKAICNVCPVLRDCSSYALSIREPFGIWGGMTEGDRKEVFAASAAR
jgi:WhiB family transcriptional regulator, redox-sensing transcriptional regulator